MGDSREVRVDCRGERCPAPIFKVAKVAKAAPPGALLVVLSDDPAFPKDIEAGVSQRYRSVVPLDGQ
ncbi:MAG: sulfurtransferase TusA family protein [Deltaproteobacteria bacterium]|nr:sulfurtransferase TusA family protein [Deltaproteobacteria bacterium]